MSRLPSLFFLPSAALGLFFAGVHFSEPAANAAEPGPTGTIPARESTLVPLPGNTDAPAAPELALLMAVLQRLTHKLALSADAGNAPLAAFYLHESLEQLRAIQKDSPEYENQPIAVLIDRIALPAYADLQTSLNYPATPPAPATREVLLRSLDRVIASCNECHVATQHGVIQITRGTEVNPFNQSFRPATAPPW